MVDGSMSDARTESDNADTRAARSVGSTLFLVGFLVLFLELACIRWFAAYVVFLQFFTNVVLIASFLGMSCGCLAARGRRDWLALFPVIALCAVLGAVAMLIIYTGWAGLAVDVGDQNSPQAVFFGTEDRDTDVARFVVPIEFVMAIFFVLVALMFVGLGQVLGRAFAAHPKRVLAYTYNIGGSLAGITVFTAFGYFQFGPLLWFAVACAGVGALLYWQERLRIAHVVALALVVVLIGEADRLPVNGQRDLRWSPYYAVRYDPESGAIGVNTIGHQVMQPFDRAAPSYSLIHLLQKAGGGKPFQDVLIIGAGSGNDMAHALRFGVGQIDAVEIDPVIQDIGIHHHPDRPYQDRRVTRHLDDGRHFLRVTERKYDLVVYALVDSLILHSGYANLRLESYLFTEQAFADIRRVLKPGGVFVTYNFFRQGWIVERVAGMAKEVFGAEPVVLGFPYQETQNADADAGFMMVIAGGDRRFNDLFVQRGSFQLNVLPPRNLDVDGFAVPAERLVEAPPGRWEKIGPTRLISDAGEIAGATDAWPFLYLKERVVPYLSLRSILILGLIGLVMVYAFMPGHRIRLDSRMFFLGAAFMLLETKAVVQLALLFGSTWLVNSMVFFTVLLLLLCANLYVLIIQQPRLGRHYAGLLALLALGMFVPFDAFLDGGWVWRYLLPCLFSLGPMFFAGVIFASSFRAARDPDQAFGSNIAGSVLGAMSESLSMLVGFQYIVLVAALFYVLSIYAPGVRMRTAG